MLCKLIFETEYLNKVQTVKLTYRLPDTQLDRQTDKLTYRLTDTQLDRQTDKLVKDRRFTDSRSKIVIDRRTLNNYTKVIKRPKQITRVQKNYK